MLEIHGRQVEQQGAKRPEEHDRSETDDAQLNRQLVRRSACISVYTNPPQQISRSLGALVSTQVAYKKSGSPRPASGSRGWSGALANGWMIWVTFECRRATDPLAPFSPGFAHREGLGMRGPGRAGNAANFNARSNARKPLTPGPSPRSGARGARYSSLRELPNSAKMLQSRPGVRGFPRDTCERIFGPISLLAPSSPALLCAQSKQPLDRLLRLLSPGHRHGGWRAMMTLTLVLGAIFEPANQLHQLLDRFVIGGFSFFDRR